MSAMPAGRGGGPAGDRVQAMVQAVPSPRDSRSSSMWSTTIPPRGITWGPPSRSAGSTTPRYYRPHPGDPRLYADYTGCGNTVDLRHPRVLAAGPRQPAVLGHGDARRWLPFRHCAGPGPGRQRGQHRQAEFITRCRQDPIVSAGKAHRRALGSGPGWLSAGRFPAGWSEWNDKYRNTVRQFWRGDPGQVGQVASRLCRAAAISTKRAGVRRRPA